MNKKHILLSICIFLFLINIPNIAYAKNTNTTKDPIIAGLAFTDESPYYPGDIVRVSAYVVNNLNEYVQIKIEYYIIGLDETNDHISISGTFIDNPIYPQFVRTRSFGKLIPNAAPNGQYKWGGDLFYRADSTGGDWVEVTPENFFITFEVSH